MCIVNPIKVFQSVVIVKGRMVERWIYGMHASNWSAMLSNVPMSIYEGRSICNENSPVYPKVLYLHTSLLLLSNGLFLG